MYTMTIRTTLAALMLCLALAACNLSGEQGLSYRKNATEPAALAYQLDNVAREFPISELEHVATVPKLPEAEGKVIGIITQDQRIESVDELTLSKILHPFITEHLAKTTPKYKSFEIGHSRFLLSHAGSMLLVVDFTVDNSVHTGYLEVALNTHAKHTWPKTIFLPHECPVWKCVRDRSGLCDEDEGICSAIVNPSGWGFICRCIMPGMTGEKEDGCSWR